MKQERLLMLSCQLLISYESPSSNSVATHRGGSGAKYPVLLQVGFILVLEGVREIYYISSTHLVYQRKSTRL